MAVTLGPNGIIFSDGTSQGGLPAQVDNGELIGINTFTSSGTYTAPANCRRVYVKLVGGGGGSAGYCESGGSGGYAEGSFNINPGDTVSVTVGGAGGGVGYYAAAGDGGTSSFGSYLSATGGYGANRNYSHTGGHGGYGVGPVAAHGSGGTGHANHHGHGGIMKGGPSYFGGPKSRRHSGAEVIGDGAPGAGAPGSITDNGSGGTNGNSGLVIVYSYT